MPERTRPNPKSPHEQAWWDHLAADRLSLQRCSACGFVRHPPGPVCPECWSEEFAWQAMSGQGRVLSFVWYLKSLDRRFQEVPYNVALVELAEGPALITNVIDCAFGDLQVGDAVRACYAREKGFTALLFRKVG